MHRVLAARFLSAELITCVLDLGRSSEGDHQFKNLFTSMLFRSEVAVPGFDFITRSPMTFQVNPKKKVKLIIGRCQIDCEEAQSILESADHFVVSQAPGHPVVQLGGNSTGCIFVGHEETIMREGIPTNPSSLWMLEYYCEPESFFGEILTAAKKIFEKVKDIVGIDLSACSAKIGSLQAIFPEDRIRTRISGGWKGNQIGVEVQLRNPLMLSEDYSIVFRGYALGCLVYSIRYPLDRSLFVINCPAQLQGLGVEIYSTNGLIVHRHQGTIFRSFGLQMSFQSQEISIDIGGNRLPVKTSRGSTTHSRGGMLDVVWHKKYRLMEIQKKSDEHSHQMMIFEGGPTDREMAVTSIRNIIHAPTKLLMICDPYFTADDALEFLPYVFDISTEVQILTSMKRPPETSRAAEAEETTAMTLKQALNLLRRHRDGANGYSNLTVKVGSTPFHDRFIITSNGAWQLGASLNHIGSVVSTITRIDPKNSIEDLFTRHWDMAKETE